MNKDLVHQQVIHDENDAKNTKAKIQNNSANTISLAAVGSHLKIEWNIDDNHPMIFQRRSYKQQLAFQRKCY